MQVFRSIRFPDISIAPEDFRDDTPFAPQPAPTLARGTDEWIEGLETFPLKGNTDARGSLFELSVFDQGP